jgi:hypothetical protein
LWTLDFCQGLFGEIIMFRNFYLLPALLFLAGFTCASIHTIANPGGPYYSGTLANGSFMPVHLDAYGSVFADTYWWDTDNDGLFGPEDTNGSVYLGTSAGDGEGAELTLQPELFQIGRTVAISLRAMGPGVDSYEGETTVTPTDLSSSVFPAADAGGPYSVNYGSDLILNAGAGLANASTVDWQIFSQPRTIGQPGGTWTESGLTATITFAQIETLLGYSLSPGDTFYVRQRAAASGDFGNFIETSTTTVSVVPEPSCLVLLNAGCLVLFGYRKKA